MRNPRAACRLVATAATALCCLAGGVAQADETTAAAAQELFNDAKALMKTKDYASACPKLEESQRLEPAGGTLLFLALCRDGEGKTASAWARFNEAVSVARRDGRKDRERVAQEHIADLTPRLTRLTVIVSEQAAATEGLVVRRDGEELARPLWGNALPVDPGEHEVTASAPTTKPWTAKVATAGPGATATVTVPPLEAGPQPQPVSREPPAVMAPRGPAPLPPEQAAPAGSGRQTAAIVVGAVGIVGLGVGAVFGGLALSKKSQVDETSNCPGGSSGGCTGAGVSLSKTAVTDGNVSTVALAIGGAAVLTAAVVWLTAPKSTPATTARAWHLTPAVGARSGELVLAGAW
jgi:hypothetical protein